MPVSNHTRRRQLSLSLSPILSSFFLFLFFSHSLFFFFLSLPLSLSSFLSTPLFLSFFLLLCFSLSFFPSLSFDMDQSRDWSPSIEPKAPVGAAIKSRFFQLPRRNKRGGFYLWNGFRKDWMGEKDEAAVGGQADKANREGEREREIDI